MFGIILPSPKYSVTFIIVVVVVVVVVDSNIFASEAK